MYIHMYVCMYVYIYIYIYAFISNVQIFKKKEIKDSIRGLHDVNTVLAVLKLRRTMCRFISAG